MGFWKKAGKVAAIAAVGTAAVGTVALVGVAIDDMNDVERERLLARLDDHHFLNGHSSDEKFVVTRSTSRGLFPRETIIVKKKNRYGRTVGRVEMTTEEVFGETRTTVRRRHY